MGVYAHVWGWDSDMESWVGSGIQWEANDGSDFGGNPDFGCLETYTDPDEAGGSAKTRTATITGLTWEDIGVPSGEVVENISGQFRIKLLSVFGPFIEVACTVGIYATADDTLIATVYDDATQRTGMLTGAWQSAIGSLDNVDPAYSASTTGIYIVLSLSSGSNAISYGWEFRVDTLEITTYTADTSSGSGEVTIQGNIKLGPNSPAKERTLTALYKVKDGNELVPLPAGCKPDPYHPDTYCKTGTLYAYQVDTDCDGNFGPIVLPHDNVVKFVLCYGPHIVNPNFVFCGSGSDGYYFVLDPDLSDLYECTVNASAGWWADQNTEVYFDEIAGSVLPSGANFTTDRYVRDSSYEIGISQCTGDYEATLYAGRIGPYYLHLAICAVIPDPISGVLDGTFTIEACPAQSALGPFDALVPTTVTLLGINGHTYYPLGGVNVTITDTCGDSVTSTSLSTPLDSIGITSLGSLDWTKIDSFTINSGVPGSCDIATWTRGNPITFLGGNTLLLYSPLLTGLENYCPSKGEWNGDWRLVTLNAIVKDCSSADPIEGLRCSVDIDDDNGTIVVAWANAAGKLYSMVNAQYSECVNREDGSFGWTEQCEIESANADDIGLCFLPGKRLYLTYDLSGAKKYRTHNKLGRGTASDWSASATPNPNVSRISQNGRANPQAFRFRALGGTPNAYSGAGDIEFSLCKENTGAEWTTAVTAVTGGRGLYCGGCFMESRYGLLYRKDSDGKAYWKTTDNPDSWGGGTGTDVSATITWYPVSLEMTLSGTLVALLWDAGSTNTFKAARSRDGGTTWEQDSASIDAIPALTIPPQLCLYDEYMFAVWVANDSPCLAYSVDGGVTWVS